MSEGSIRRSLDWTMKELEKVREKYPNLISEQYIAEFKSKDRLKIEDLPKIANNYCRFYNLPIVKLKITETAKGYIGYFHSITVFNNGVESWNIIEKVIEIVKPLIEFSPSTFLKNCILHEVAHYYQLYKYGFFSFKNHDTKFYQIIESYSPYAFLADYCFMNENFDLKQWEIDKIKAKKKYENQKWLEIQRRIFKIRTERKRTKRRQKRLNALYEKIEEIN